MPDANQNRCHLQLTHHKNLPLNDSNERYVYGHQNEEEKEPFYIVSQIQLWHDIRKYILNSNCFHMNWYRFYYAIQPNSLEIFYVSR